MKFLVVFLLLSSQWAWAQSSRLNAVEDYQDDTWAITFGSAVTNTQLNHNESSTVPDYSSTGRTVVIPDVKISLSLMKEFMASSTISFTAKLLGGMTDSDGTASGDNLTEITESLSSIHYGGGLSVNWNLYSYGLKIQPYVGVSFINETGEYNLTHEESGVTLNTIHEFQTTFINPGLGVRIFDADYGLMSYFEVSSPSTMSGTLTPKAQASGNDIEIESSTEVKYLNVAFSLGFGYYF